MVLSCFALDGVLLSTDGGTMSLLPEETPTGITASAVDVDGGGEGLAVGMIIEDESVFCNIFTSAQFLR